MLSLLDYYKFVTIYFRVIRIILKFVSYFPMLIVKRKKKINKIMQRGSTTFLCLKLY